MSGDRELAGWRVLLIGGASAAGKTTAARELGGRLGVSVLVADDLRLAMQRAVPEAAAPELHAMLDLNGDAWRNADAHRDALIAVARFVTEGVTAIVENHVQRLAEVTPLIIEGDSLLPELADGRSEVRMVMIEGDDEPALRQRMLERGRGFESLSSAAQQANAAGAVRYGAWLADQAREHAVPVLSAAPHDSLPDRILDVVGLPAL